MPNAPVPAPSAPAFPSPNFSSRNGRPITVLLLHATAGRNSRDWLCNPRPVNRKTGLVDPHLRVSAHYLITKKGEVLQLVDEANCAWHAGASQWHGVDDNNGTLNDESVGIELENMNDGVDPYPPEQLAAAVKLSQEIVARYTIIRDRCRSPDRRCLICSGSACLRIAVRDTLRV